MKTPTPGGVPPLARALALVGVAFVVLPLAGLVVRAPWHRLAEVLADPATAQALRLSFVVAGAATALSFGIGLPLGWTLARSSGRTWSAVRVAVLLPLVLPPVVGGVALLAALGRRGLLGAPLAYAAIQLPFSTAGAILAATFVSFPLFVLAVEAGFRGLDPRLEAASAAMGASRGYTLRHVTLPLLRPQLAAGLTLTFARALGEFGATITFAGNLPGRTQTLTLAVYERLQSDPGAALLLALVLVGISVFLLALLRDRLGTSA